MEEKKVNEPVKVEEKKVNEKQKSSVSEKDYLIIYERLSDLMLSRSVNPKMFKADEELKDLLKKAEGYKLGAFGVREQTICVDTQKMYLHPDVRLPQTFVDKISSKKGVDKKQYLK